MWVKRLISRIYTVKLQINTKWSENSMGKKEQSIWTLSPLSYFTKNKYKIPVSICNGFQILLVTRKIRSKISMVYTYQEAKIVKRNDKTDFDKNKEWLGLVYCLWKCLLVEPLWKTVQQFILMLNTRLPYPSILLQAIYATNQSSMATRVMKKIVCNLIYCCYL